MVKKLLKAKKVKWAIALMLVADLALIGSLSSGSTEALPPALLLIALSVLLVISAAKKVNSPPVPSVSVSCTEKPSLKINITTSSSSYCVDRLIADGENVTLVQVGEENCPSGGFLNWSIYQVIGINESTKRKNKRQYEAKNETDLISKAKADGLIEPFEVTVIPHEEPTEKQLEYLQSFGLSAPAGAKRHDISAILSRLEDATDVVSQKTISADRREERVRPLPSPTEEFANFADSMGVMFSRYIGKFALFNNTVYSLHGRDRIAFYAYCIICDHVKVEIGDMRNSEYYRRLYEFADKAAYDQSLLRSIEGRSTNDYLHPHKGTVAYKSVVEFFGLK